MAILGLLQRFHFINLPSSLTVLSHPLVLGLAIVLYAIDIVADKVPSV